jgi:hypothetical protein
MAQRVDLELNTVNDGLHGSGEGVWLLHDHQERAFTTDGIHPGGSATAIVYRSYLNDNGWPKMQGIDWAPFFTPQYYKREVPVWATYDETGMLGEVSARTPRVGRAVVLGFVVGLLLGGLVVLVRSRAKRNREA